MTKEELRQFYYLNREIINDTEELVALKIKSRGEAQSRWEKEQEKLIAWREAELVKKVQRCKKMRDEIGRYINSIDDSFVRQIFRYRFMKCMSWKKVAYMIGGCNSPDSVRKIAERFLKKQK